MVIDAEYCWETIFRWMEIMFASDNYVTTIISVSFVLLYTPNTIIYHWLSSIELESVLCNKRLFKIYFSILWTNFILKFYHRFSFTTSMVWIQSSNQNRLVSVWNNIWPRWYYPKHEFEMNVYLRFQHFPLLYFKRSQLFQNEWVQNWANPEIFKTKQNKCFFLRVSLMRIYLNVHISS